MSELPPSRPRRGAPRRSNTPEAIKQRSPARRRYRREYNREWGRANPERKRSHQLKHKYGITQEEWDALFEAQGRCCAACKRTDPGSSRGWHLDHRHEPFKIRGILCFGCNTTLGHHKDCPERLMQLALYAEKHR